MRCTKQEGWEHRRASSSDAPTSKFTYIEMEALGSSPQQIILQLILEGSILLIFFTSARRIHPHDHTEQAYTWQEFLAWFHGSPGRTHAWTTVNDGRSVQVREGCYKRRWSLHPLVHVRAYSTNTWLVIPTSNVSYSSAPNIMRRMAFTGRKPSKPAKLNRCNSETYWEHTWHIAPHKLGKNFSSVQVHSTEKIYCTYCQQECAIRPRPVAIHSACTRYCALQQMPLERALYSNNDLRQADQQWFALAPSKFAFILALLI